MRVRRGQVAPLRAGLLLWKRKVAFASLKGAAKGQIAYYMKRALGISAEKYPGNAK